MPLLPSPLDSVLAIPTVTTLVLAITVCFLGYCRNLPGFSALSLTSLKSILHAKSPFKRPKPSGTAHHSSCKVQTP